MPSGACTSFDRPAGGQGELAVEIRLRLRQKLALPLAGLVLAWYLAAPSPSALATLVVIFGGLLAAYLWARSMARQVSGQRSLRYAAVQVGDELEEQVTLRSTTLLPVLWAEFTDQSDLPGYTVTSVRAAGSRETVSWRAHTTCTRRGLFRLGPWELRLGEPFGLFEVRQLYAQKNELLVYPPIAPLPEHLLPRGRTQGEQRTLNQPLLAETQSAFTARPYQPGDPLRHLHWPTTARRDAPFVKVFEPEASSTVWLVADSDAAAHTGQGPDSTLETMVILLASLASRLQGEGLAVGLFAFSGAAFPGNHDSPAPHEAPRAAACLRPRVSLHSPMPPARRPVILPPQRGMAQQWKILSALAQLRPAPGQNFRSALRQVRPLVSGRDLVVAVTPSLDPAWLEGLHPFAHTHLRSAGPGHPGGLRPVRQPAGGASRSSRHLHPPAGRAGRAGRGGAAGTS